MLTEAATCPAVASLAQTAYGQVVPGRVVDYRVLNDLIGEASGKGILRSIYYKYSSTAHETVTSPICQEIGRQAPIRSQRPELRPTAGMTPSAPPAGRLADLFRSSRTTPSGPRRDCSDRWGAWRPSRVSWSGPERRSGVKPGFHYLPGW